MTVHEEITPRPAIALHRPRAALLRWLLRIDGAVGVVNGLAYLLAGSLLSDLLGLPTALLAPVGVFLLAYGAVLAAMSARSELRGWTVVVVVLLDVAWVLDSLLVAFGGWFTPSALGLEWVLVQAAAVGTVGVLKYVGLRRATGTA